MADRYYLNWPIQPGPVELGGPEAHHLAAVCRVHPGDHVCLFNGDGHEYPATVTVCGKRSVSLEVLGVETPQRELGFRLEIAAPLPKGDRAQFLVEKLTELGVTRFVPLRTQRSVVHPRDAKLDKLERYVIEASKQCGRNVLMRIEPLTEWENFCKQVELPASRWVAHPCGEVTLAEWDAERSSRDVVCAVGPEGGFTKEEAALAKSVGWLMVSLGPRILRVETAALVLAALATAHCPLPTATNPASAAP